MRFLTTLMIQQKKVCKVREVLDTKKIILTAIIVIILIGCLIFIITKPEKTIIQGEVECQTIDVSSKIPGRINVINVKKGDSVEKGATLVVLDTPDIEAKSEQSLAVLDIAEAERQKAYTGARKEQIDAAYNTMQQANAGLELAQKTYDRLKRLHNEGVIATQKLDEAKASYDNAFNAQKVAQANYYMYKTGTRAEDKLAATANVKRAKGIVKEATSYLKENTLKAPVKAEVTEISAEVGELVGTGYPIVTLTNLDDTWVTFNLREDMLTKIKMGAVIEAKFPALGKDTYKLKVNYISVLGDFATWRATKAKGDFDMKTFEVRAIPVDKIEGLRAGMTALVDWNKIK